MTLPNSYVQTGRISDYFEAMVNAEAPSRFSTRFLEKLGFKSSNDRAFIGILKDLNFIDADGKPLPRYFEFLDKSQWRRIVAIATQEAFEDLFAINKKAYELSADEARNKLRTLYAGQKSDNVIRLIAKTFEELVSIGDFSEEDDLDDENLYEYPVSGDDSSSQNGNTYEPPLQRQREIQRIGLNSLQYHINIVLPETRDQSVYDAIFRSLREHLG